MSNEAPIPGLDDIRLAVIGLGYVGLPLAVEFGKTRPVTGFDISQAPGCRETTINGQNGYLVPVKDANALASKMRDLIDNVDLRVSMGQKSREIATSKYNVRAVNRTLMQHLGLAT